MVDFLQRLFWGWHVLLLILAAGAYFSWATGFYQLRCLGRWLRAALCPPEEKGGITSFQALTAALAGSLGTGNIVGVGVALAAGGPGALFWMWVSALLGMMTVYAENVLAARHREAPGPLGYLRRAGRWGGVLAGVYALGCCLSSLGMGNMAQTNAAGTALTDLGLPLWATAAVLGLLAWAAARGGLGFGVKITQRLVPLMSLLFFGAAVWVLWDCRQNLPAALASVFREAFSLKAGAGGTLAGLTALQVGVSRGVFTNEAGLGSSAFAYDGVQGRSPEELGCLGIFQVFADTIVMCTVTGLCVLGSGVTGDPGTLVTAAFESALGPWGGRAVSLSTALFAAATLTAWSCYGREGLAYLTGGRGRELYALAAGGAAVLGCFLPLGAVFQLGDAMNGLMALPNLCALFLLRREVRGDLKAQKQKYFMENFRKKPGNFPGLMIK